MKAQRLSPLPTRPYTQDLLFKAHTYTIRYAVMLARSCSSSNKIVSHALLSSAMVQLSATRQFELRAKTALENGDTSFKPRGKANRSAFAKMKEEFASQARQVNAHTSTEADRIIEETTSRVLETIGQHTQALPEQIDMATRLAGPTTAASVLNSILLDIEMNCKGTKADKAALLARKVPVDKLVALLAKHGGRTAKAKASSSAATPQEQDSKCEV